MKYENRIIRMFALSVDKVDVKRKALGPRGILKWLRLDWTTRESHWIYTRFTDLHFRFALYKTCFCLSRKALHFSFTPQSVNGLRILRKLSVALPSFAFLSPLPSGLKDFHPSFKKDYSISCARIQVNKISRMSWDTVG